MSDLQQMEQERSVLRWGGLAGMLGGILFILTWVIVGLGPVGMEDPADLAGWVTRFPDIRAARVVENLVYLVALILEVALFLALYRALRRTSLAPALFGSVLGILGLVVYMVGALPHVTHAPLSDLYLAPGANPEAKATIALMWQATWGIFDAVLYVGFFVVPTGLILLGVAMLGSPAFGKGLGWVSIVLGVLGLVAAILQMVDPSSMIGAGSYFACLIFYLVLGWKVFGLSRARGES
jgi:predicted membrane channel-forming protein YqfA (hemolysin III family)